MKEGMQVPSKRMNAGMKEGMQVPGDQVNEGANKCRRNAREKEGIARS